MKNIDTKELVIHVSSKIDDLLQLKSQFKSNGRKAFVITKDILECKYKYSYEYSSYVIKKLLIENKILLLEGNISDKKLQKILGKLKSACVDVNLIDWNN